MNTDPLASVLLYLVRLECRGHTANAMKVINKEELTRVFGIWAARPSARQSDPPQVEASGIKENTQAPRAGHTGSPHVHYRGHCKCCSEGKTSN